jgi:hypothetical protein
MSSPEHLSDLALDLVATAASPALIDPASLAHLDGCAECRVRLVSRTAPITHDLPAIPPRRARWKAIGIPVALAVCAIAIGLAAASGGLSGASAVNGDRPALMLVSPETGEPVGELAPGARVKLSIQPAGAPFAIIFSIDTEGAVDRIWPRHLAHSAPLDLEPEIRPPDTYHVTPGPAALLAFFSDRPLQDQAVRSQLEAAVAGAGQAPSPASLLELDPPPVKGERARARTVLRVKGDP